MSGPPGDLILDRVTKRFEGQGGEPLTVLKEVSCIVHPAETVAIVGPSGSGKSTLLNIIGALDKPTSGQVHLGGSSVSALEGRALASFRASSVGFVFQDHHLLNQLTALENVLLPTLASPAEGDSEQRAEMLLERIGLAERRHAFPAQLSGGERQRVALARALINSAKLLLCDEPTGNLDAHTGTAAVSLLLELAADDGVTVLMVTHNIEQASRFGRCLQLRDGTLFPIDIQRGEGGGR